VLTVTPDIEITKRHAALNKEREALMLHQKSLFFSPGHPCPSFCRASAYHGLSKLLSFVRYVFDFGDDQVFGWGKSSQNPSPEVSASNKRLLTLFRGVQF